MELTTAEIAMLLKIPAPTALKKIRKLNLMHLGRKHGQAWAWDPDVVVAVRAGKVGKRYTARKRGKR